MSLVNNMLKDLDQRRQSAPSTGAATDLFPAADKPKRGFFGRLFRFLILIVVVGGAGFGYLIYQNGGLENFDSLESLGSIDISRQLNIIPDLVNLPTRSNEVDTEQLRNLEAEREQQRQQLEQLQQQRESAAAVSQSAPPVQPRAETPTASAATNPIANQNAPAAELPRNLVQPSAPAESAPAAANNLNNSVNSPADQAIANSAVPAPASPLEATTAQESQSLPNALEGSSEQSGQAQLPPSEVATADIDYEAATSGVINRPPSETVKNYAEMSPEERDTLAVQYALRLIQSNDLNQAYASMEEHVMQNRYAHQTRETYAKLLVNEGNLLAARNLVETGLQLAPNHAGFKKVKARILIGNGDIADAVTLLESRAPAVHEDIEYHELLATAQLASRDFEGAQLSYTGLVRQDQSQGRWWYGLAASHDSLGNRQAARQAYSRAAAQSNLSPNLRRRVQDRLTVLGQ